MRSVKFAIISTILIFVQALFAVSPASADCTITSTLQTGSKGLEVECLQGKIGVVVDGNFGPLTEASVMAFQSSHGLVADGMVGPITLGVLNNPVIDNGIYPLGCSSSIGYSPTTGIKCDTVSNPSAFSTLEPVSNNPNPTPPVVNSAKVNANIVNLDQFINKVVEVNRKNGKSEEQLKLIASSLRTTVMNSDIDYNKKFKDLLASEAATGFNNTPSSNLFNKVISNTLSFFGIKPETAQAATGIPFGGALLFPFFCAYNSSWMISIEPLPPTYVALLTYYPGTQGFASYNIPFTRWLLGAYVTPGVCVVPAGPYPLTIPTEGTITPMVGSSPL